MFGQHSMSNLTFVCRQLAALLEDHELEPALVRLADAAPPKFASDIEQLRAVLSGPVPPMLGASPLATLLKLMPAAGAKRTAVFQRFVDYVEQNRAVFRAYFRSVLGLVVYLTLVGFIAVFVTTLFVRFIHPQFAALFASMGQSLPAVTQFVFGAAGTRAVLLCMPILLLIGLGIVATVVTVRRVESLEPLPSFVSRVPILGRLARTYNHGLFLNFARILKHAGVDDALAVDAAATAAGSTPSMSLGSLVELPPNVAHGRALEQLGIASRLDVFERELSVQCEQHIEELIHELAHVRDRFALVLRVAVFVYIGVLVVAMYQPIFMLGTLN